MAGIEVVTADGRPEVLTAERWNHIVEGHPELSDHQEVISAAIRSPARLVPGRRPNESWYYGRGGPSRFVQVIVEWTEEVGVVVTAFARRRFP